MSIRRALGASALAALAPVMLIAGTVPAADAARDCHRRRSPSRPPTTRRPAVRRSTSAGSSSTRAPADHEPVKVQRLFQGTWSTLTGAVVRTTSDGHVRDAGHPADQGRPRPCGSSGHRCLGLAHDAFKRFTRPSTDRPSRQTAPPPPAQRSGRSDVALRLQRRDPCVRVRRRSAEAAGDVVLGRRLSGLREDLRRRAVLDQLAGLARRRRG